MRIGVDTSFSNQGLRGLTAMRDGFRDRAIRTMIGAALVLTCGSPRLPASATLVLSPDGITVHDTVNNINWLADANLAATNRFGLPVCNASGTQPCVNASGSMSYQAAAAWVQAMNAASYLGHTNWQLPTTPLADSGCGFTGPQNNSFGFNCAASALGALYYNALSIGGITANVTLCRHQRGPGPVSIQRGGAGVAGERRSAYQGDLWGTKHAGWNTDHGSPMKYPHFIAALLALNGLPAAFAQSPTITYVPSSSVKLYQVNGDCDWAVWDATITNKTPTCKPTVSQTLTKADVLGDDVPVVFENNGEMIVTFGDTIGAANYAAWADVQNSFLWQAHDPIARSTTMNASDGLLLNFFLSGNHGLDVQPPPQANGTAVSMGIDDVPNTGVSLNGTIYVGIKTGNVNVATGDNDQSKDYSVLTTFNQTTQSFASGRTISVVPGGNFASPVFYLAPTGVLGSPAPVSPEPVMLIFGAAGARSSDIYLSIIPSTEFASGFDQNGNSATRYFSGMNNGQPTWSTSEPSAVPIVYGLDPANPTIGNLSVFYSQPLGLWLMMYDDHSGTLATKGIYFTSAPKPWGPWSAPQLVFNACRDNGYGNFIFYHYATAAQNQCPSAMPAGVTSVPGSAGPAGPTIGDQTVNDPNTTQGDPYAPELVERFTIISGNTLKLFYLIATWNPYAVVMMESDFNIAYGPVISEVANAEGESPAVAPNTWVEIKGTNLAPAGDSRTWQSSDFVGNQMPTQLDHVSATVNGKNAYVYYISPTQINILTPPDTLTDSVQVVVTNAGTAGAAFTAQAQSISPSFFVFNGGPYVAAVHLNGSLIGPTTLYPGLSTPAKPGEMVALYANGFGQTTTVVVSGSPTQGGSLIPLPAIKIGGVTAAVQFAGLVAVGQYQFNVVVPSGLANGDQSITTTYSGQTTQAGALIAIQN